MPRQIDVGRLFTDLDYYCASLLVIKPKEANVCRLRLNPAQRLVYYGISPEQRQKDRRFQHVILDRGWKEYEEKKIPLRQYILKARQEGMSTLCESRLFQKAHTRPGTNALVVAQDDEATSGIFQMARMFYANLPKELKPQIKNSNARELLFQSQDGAGGLNSGIRTQTAGWRNIGRSKTIHHLHLSEVSFWNDPEAVTDGLFEAVPGHPDTSIIIETTAQGLGTWAYHAWLIAKEARENKEDGTFDPVFIPWFILPEFAKPLAPDVPFSQDDKEFKDHYGLTWEQVYWYKTKLRNFELRHPGRGLQFMKTEYPSNDFEPWQAAGQSAFADMIIENIYKYQVQAPAVRSTVVNKDILKDTNGKLRIWERPRPGVQYGIGVDVAHGVGQDYSVVCVLAHPGYRQVAEWSDNRTGGPEFAKVIEAIARWYNEAVVAVEVTGSGILLNAILGETYSNLYRWEYFDKQKQVETSKTGWETTERTKELLIDHANSLFTPDVRAVVRSENVAEEMRLMRMATLGVSGNARYVFLNHTGDHLMAWLIACMCLWRKVARYDLGDALNVMDTPKVDVADAYMYDAKTAEITAGTLPREEYFGNDGLGATDGWLNY